MHRTMMALALAGAAGALGGCGLFQDIRSVSAEMAKGNGNTDDFGSGAPLTLPPDSSLRPPSTSTAATSGEATSRRTQIILKTTDPAAGSGAATARTGREVGPTSGERELLTRSGYNGATSDVVRKTVDIESERRSSGQKDFTDRVMKYDPDAKPAAGDEKNARDATGDRPVIKRPGEF